MGYLPYRLKLKLRKLDFDLKKDDLYVLTEEREHILMYNLQNQHPFFTHAYFPMTSFLCTKQYHKYIKEANFGIHSCLSFSPKNGDI